MALFDEGLLAPLSYAQGRNLKDTVEAIRTELINVLQNLAFSVNVLNEDNFPNAVSGGKILKTDHSTPLSVLTVREIPIALLLPPQPASTTSTLDCGGFFYWDPLRYPGGSWYLEASLKQAGGGTTTLQLKQGTLVVGSVSTTNTDWTLVRSSAPLTMPTTAGALTLTLASSASTVTAYVWTVRLIWVP